MSISILSVSVEEAIQCPRNMVDPVSVPPRKKQSKKKKKRTTSTYVHHQLTIYVSDRVKDRNAVSETIRPLDPSPPLSALPDRISPVLHAECLLCTSVPESAAAAVITSGISCSRLMDRFISLGR